MEVVVVDVGVVMVGDVVVVMVVEIVVVAAAAVALVGRGRMWRSTKDHASTPRARINIQHT